MNLLETLVLVLHLMIALAICGFVLLQHGKGADMGAAFGSGASGSLFGASGSANFLSRSTGVLAALFFATSLGLTWFATTHGPAKGVMQQGVAEKAPAKSSEIPASPATLPGAPASSDPAKSVPATAPEGSKSSEVPK